MIWMPALLFRNKYSLLRERNFISGSTGKVLEESSCESDSNSVKTTFPFASLGAFGVPSIFPSFRHKSASLLLSAVSTTASISSLDILFQVWNEFHFEDKRKKLAEKWIGTISRSSITSQAPFTSFCFGTHLPRFG